jgi:subtilisin family serine protease
VRRGANGERTKISKAELSAMRTLRSGALGVPTYPVEGSINDNWGWWQINASVIWPEKKASPTVCVLDTGADIAHPDLVGKVTNGYDYVNADTIANDDNGHGTHVTGTIVASMNNKKGFSGVSNGKAIAVKVLNAQSWGTSFDISSGIRFCADNATVKVINMSFGTSVADTVEFNALEYAIVTKGKLVVAAAGNDSSSVYVFPAAWAADYVCKDGTDASFPAACPAGINANTISTGLLSVGAGRSPTNVANDGDNGGTTDGQLWVDANFSGTEEAGELHDMEACATNFSNYGKCVQIVAPGEDIFSSLPVSYPYYDANFNNADPDRDGYDWFSGTSMASPYVAGAAARVFSIQPLAPVYTNVQLKNQLLSSGAALDVSSDPTMANPAIGYSDTGFGGEAPFCWPDAIHGDNKYDMSASVYLDVAAAMDRTALTAAVSDAVTGLPLTGATVTAYQGALLKDKALLSSKISPSVDLINLPAGVSNTVKVMKTGYTTGAATIAAFTPSVAYDTDEFLTLAIPPTTTRITLVANWDDDINLDLYTFLPLSSSGGAVIGAGNSGNAKDGGAGSLTTTGTTGVATRWNHDGGNTSYDGLGMESVTMLPRVGFPMNPFYNLPDPTVNQYDFFLTDYGHDLLNSSTIVVRLWRGGLPASIGVAPFGPVPYAYEKTVTCDIDGADNNILTTTDNETWWHIGHIGGGVGAVSGSTFTFDDTCGPATGTGAIWPYSVTNSISTGSDKP